MSTMEIKAGAMTLGDWRQVYNEPVMVSLHSSCDEKIEASRKVVQDIVASGKTVYGVNTGFGKLASKAISPERLEKLQENLILSHSTGTGALLSDEVVRLIMVMKIGALAQGYSGVRGALINAIISLVNAEVYPCIPSKGSVGASGDLAPLSHMSAVLLGHGQARHGGKVIEAAEALKIAGLEPVKLAPKEGLALINGTQVSTALALTGLFETEKAFYAAIVAGALSIDAAHGSTQPFELCLHEVRGQAGQVHVAKLYHDLLDGSAIRDSHRECTKVQDPYCLRCMPQVMGACYDTMMFVSGVLEREANAVTDNPLVFADRGEVYSGGNFHAEPVAQAADTLALAIAEIGNISERRIAMLIDEGESGLPPFLVSEAGVNSGFMIAHVTAAALASENKQMSHPACVDSIPTSANQEDHVSMATHGARRLLEMAENTATIAAIELLAAAQGIEFHRPLKSSEKLEAAMAKIRALVPAYEEDRFFAPDIEAVKKLVREGAFVVDGAL